MSQIVTIDGASLLIHHLGDESVVEAYELARALGYKQQSSLRKQLLGDWKQHFTSSHYHLVHDVQLLREYEDTFVCTVGEGDTNSIKPMKPKRGRLFLTPAGVSRALSLTTKKPRYKIGEVLYEAGFLDVKWVSLKPKSPESSQVVEGLATIRRDLITIRQHNYEVLQKLITQLQEIEDRDVILLAIEAAEIALGRQLTNLRNKYSIRPSPSEPKPQVATAPPTAPPRGSTQGPLFKKPGLYTMTEIGEMAGGYTAKSAGIAADIVARRWGHSHHEIRNVQLSFNKIEQRPDSSTGKLRPMSRFNMKFANEVVLELRANPELRPTQRLFPLTSFGAGATSQPKLSQGLFSDEDDPASH